MKLLCTVAAAVLSAAALAAETEGIGRARFDRETGKLSARLLVAEWKNSFAARDFPPGTARMEREMRAAAGNAAVRNTARANAETWFLGELQLQYRAEAQKILEPYADTLDPAEYDKLRNGDNAFYAARLKNVFPAAFQQVRDKLGAEQRRRVFRKLYPTVEELEKFNDKALTARLEKRFRQGLAEPLWEENVPLLRRELIAPAIAAGRVQQKYQLDLTLRTAVPDTLWDESAVAGHLAAAVERAVALRYPEEGRLPLFPQTRNEIRRRAAALPVERLIAAMPETLPTAGYRTQIEAAPAAHRAPDVSFSAVAPKFQQTLIARGAETARLPDALRARTVADPRTARAAERRFRENLTPRLQQERDGFSAVQLRRHWPELETSWSPRPAETEQFSASGARDLPPLRGRPAPAGLLVETEQRINSLVREKLTAEVARLETQRTAVRAEYESVLAEMRQKQAAEKSSWLSRWFGTGGVTLAEIVGSYRARVEAQSRPPLFPAVETEIEVRARAILQLLAESPEPPKPPLPVVTYTLRLREENQRLTLRFGNWSRQFPADRPPFEELTQELKRRMAETVGPSKFEVRLTVSGNRVYYRTVVQLREAVQSAVAGAGGSVRDSLQ